jgi:hypothetical protein
MKFIRYMYDENGSPKEAVFLNEKTGNLEIRKVSL